MSSVGRERRVWGSDEFGSVMMLSFDLDITKLDADV